MNREGLTAEEGTLREKIARHKGEDPLKPVTVIVPSKYVGYALRRRLTLSQRTSRDTMVAVRFITLDELAKTFAYPSLSSSGRYPLTRAALLEAVRSVLSTEKGYFAALASNPATVRAVARAVSEIRGLSPSARAGLANSSRKGRDLVALHDQIYAHLSNTFYDKEDLLHRAIEEIEAETANSERLREIILYKPRATRRDALTASFLTSLTVKVDAIEDRRFSFEEAGTGRDVKIAICGESDLEAEVVVRRVVELVEKGVALFDQAIFYPSHGPYGSYYPLALGQHLETAGIPYHSPQSLNLDETVPGNWILRLLDLVDSRWGREDVLRWLGSVPPAHQPWSTLISPADLDRITASAGIVHGLDQWIERLREYASKATAGELFRSASNWDIRTAAKLVELMNDLAVAIQQPRSNSWKAYSSWAIRLLDKFFHVASTRQDEFDHRLTQLLALGTPSSHIPTQSVLHPHSSRADSLAADSLAADSLAKVKQAIESLATLDSISTHCDLNSFRSALAEELRASSQGSTGEFGDGVLLAPISLAHGLTYSCVHVVGMAEGALPSLASDDPILSELERTATNGELATRSQLVKEEELHLLDALAASRHYLRLYCPRSSFLQSTPLAASRWLIKFASTNCVGMDKNDRSSSLISTADLSSIAFNISESAGAGGSVDTATNGGSSNSTAGEGDHLERYSASKSCLIEEIPSYFALVAAAAPATIIDYDLVLLWKHRLTGRSLRSYWLWKERPELGRSVELEMARASTTFSRFDGYVGETQSLVSSLTRVLSPTTLETYAACPRQYLFSYILNIEPVISPEEISTILPIDRGKLIHEILAKYITTLIEKEPPSFTRLEQIADNLFTEYERKGLLGKPLFWRVERFRILRELKQFYENDVIGEPIAVEQVFGMKEYPPLTIELTDGATVRFRGIIDRIDQKNESLLITDYKTGRAYEEYKQLDKDPLARGTKLQLPIYALAAKNIFTSTGKIEARYWFVTEREAFKVISINLDDATLESFYKTINQIVKAISSGIFPGRPGSRLWGGSFKNCVNCSFTQVCPLDRDKQWLLKRYDPRIAPYVELAEPVEDSDEKAE